MQKPWIVLSVAITTVMFIYAMSFVSSQNVCTWVRSYECVALKQKADSQLLVQNPVITTQQKVFVAKVQKQQIVVESPQPLTNVETIPTAKSDIPQESLKSTQQDLAAAQLSNQQAAAKLAQQKAALAASQQAAAARAAQQQAAARLAAQQAAAAAVNTTTKAS